MKHFLRNSANYVSFSLVRVFILQPVVLICLLAASGQAASDIEHDDSDVSDRLNHKPNLIPNGLFPLLDDPYSTILRAQSENPIKDESPRGEEEIDVKNEEHWNFLFGGQWEITKRWQVMAEGGAGNRRHVILGAFFRF